MRSWTRRKNFKASEPAAESGLVDEPGRLQERLLVVLTVCMTPFLIFAGVSAYLESKELRDDRRRSIAFRVEQSMDRFEAELSTGFALLSVFSDQLEQGRCSAVLARLSGDMPSLQGVAARRDGASVCSAPSAGEAELVPRPDERTVQVVRGSTGQPDTIVLSQPAREGWTIFILDADMLVSEAAGSSSGEPLLLSISDQSGVTVGPLPSVELDQRWFDAISAEQRTVLREYQSASGQDYDVIITRLGRSDLFAVVAEERLSLWRRIQLSPASTVGLPLAVFVAALLGAWVSIDRIVLRWFRPLRRMAVAYAAGQYERRPDADFSRAPHEIEKLAHTLERMAGRIGERDADLRQAIETRDDAVREIHHRVKNNLQIVNSFVSLQMRSVKSADARAAFSAVRNRIDALSIVHQTLYQHERLETVSLRPFFQALLGHLEDALGMEDSRVQLKWEVAAVDRPSDDAIPLALFVLEAVTNSMKYAFGDDGGTIEVALREDNSDLLLTIRDDGIGAAASTGDDQSTGLGGKLMKAFAKQVKGSFEMKSSADGFSVELAIPN